MTDADLARLLDAFAGSDAEIARTALLRPAGLDHHRRRAAVGAFSGLVDDDISPPTIQQVSAAPP